MPLTRRELLDLTVRAAALPGAAEFFAAWFSAGRQSPAGASPGAANQYAPPEPPLLRDYTPKFFPRVDFEVLQAFTEILIPTDDTPGAREAHCAHYIDFVLQAQSDPAVSGSVSKLSLQMRDALEQLRQIGFHAADAQGRAAMVDAMSRPERDPAASHVAYPIYRLIKRQTVFAFYTSRAGSIEALDYRGNSYNPTFPACTHPEHQVV